MPTTARSRPTASTPQQSSRLAALPPYQPLHHQLNPAAQHALQHLSTTHSLNDLKRRLQTAVNQLTEVTGDLNDQYQIRKADHDRLQARRAARVRDFESSQGNEETNEAEDEQRIGDAERDTEEWTSKMEEKTRKVIDLQARVKDGETALQQLNANISLAGRSATQSTLGASQHRPHRPLHRRRRRRHRNQEEAGEDSEEEEDGPADDNEDTTTHTGPPPFTSFQAKIAASAAAYDSLSLKDRYAAQNDYIGFRKILHDALHPTDDTPLPHPSTWFPAAPPSSSSNNNNNLAKPARTRTHLSTTSPSPVNNNDDEEDILIARETRSLKCPLTLLPLRDPLSSTLCPHSFEADAILSMLASSSLRKDAEPNGARGSAAEKSIKCPECEVELCRGDLRRDVVLLRKIRRVEERERRERDGEDGMEGDVVVGEEVTSSPAREREREQMVVKREGMQGVRREGVQGLKTSRVSPSRELSMVPATQLGGGDEEEGGEDDDDEEEEDWYAEED
ncbi:MAG: hypothetical protein Q9219_003293 [cf. Caloplaca sp. 3 TL-2023]